ncbi:MULTISPECIES: alpha/beta hydrolase [Luteimonas]|uniref:alpha/beta hydrolase n=1 Tax=Luteimonas TaxID=83614 RepID=UPI000C7A5A13|nr:MULTISPECIES: alpha/beta fold hydrolase [Luteimonas]
MRALGLLTALAVLAYAGVCVAMFLMQRSLLYFPAATRVDPATTTFEVARGDVTLRGWAIGPEAGAPVLYFGGNSERVEQNRDDFARWLPQRRVYLLAYRGYGASDGDPDGAAMRADALAFHDAVRRHHPGQAVDVIGRSLGGGIASHVAAQRDVRRLALITPFDRLAHVAQGHYPWLPVRWLLRDDHDVAADLATFDGRVLVLRAGRDAVVPPRHTDRLLAHLPGTPDVASFADAGHNDIQAQPGYADTLSAFLD